MINFEATKKEAIGKSVYEVGTIDNRVFGSLSARFEGFSKTDWQDKITDTAFEFMPYVLVSANVWQNDTFAKMPQPDTEVIKNIATRVANATWIAWNLPEDDAIALIVKAYEFNMLERGIIKNSGGGQSSPSTKQTNEGDVATASLKDTEGVNSEEIILQPATSVSEAK